jgi:hypothetical protein
VSKRSGARIRIEVTAKDIRAVSFIRKFDAVGPKAVKPFVFHLTPAAS